MTTTLYTFDSIMELIPDEAKAQFRIKHIGEEYNLFMIADRKYTYDIVIPIDKIRDIEVSETAVRILSPLFRMTIFIKTDMVNFQLF